MWYLFKFIGFLIKMAVMAVLLAIIGVIAALFILDRGVPDSLVQRALDKIPADVVILRVGRVSFSLGTGVKVEDIKVFPKSITEKPLVTASEVVIDVGVSPTMPLNRRLRSITIKNLDFPTVPRKNRSSHVASVTNAPAPSPEAAVAAVVTNAVPGMGILLPTIEPFKLHLQKCAILGLLADDVQATIVVQHPKVVISELKVVLPDSASGGLPVTGTATLNVEEQRVIGEAAGQAYPHNIVPLLRELHAKGAVRQIDPFGDFKHPINVKYNLDIELVHADFAMQIGIDCGPCTYYGVPFERVRGSVYVTDTNRLTTVDIGPIDAVSQSGPITGTLNYRSNTDMLAIDAKTTMQKEHLLAIINVLNHGELDSIHCETNLTFEGKGEIAIDVHHSARPTDFDAKLGLAKGRILNVPVLDMKADMKLAGYSAAFSNVSARTPHGGKIEGNIVFHYPNYVASNTTFTTELSVTNAAMNELLRVANVTNEMAGVVDGKLTLKGGVTGRILKSFDGVGSVNISQSVLSRMPLFAGFTEWMSSNVPGVGALVTQSSGTMDFTVQQGVLKTENLKIEGNIFGLICRGTYDLDADAIDMVARSRFFRSNTVTGFITSLFANPVSWVLLEFRVFGSIKKPEWKYLSVVEKLMDSMSDSTPSEKSGKGGHAEK